MAKSKLIKELGRGEIGLVSAFNRLLILASDIENDGLQKWAIRELNGYEKFEDLPRYRIINAPNLQFTGLSGHVKLTNVPVPQNYLKTKTWDAISEVGIFGGINELEKYSQLKDNTYRDLTVLAGEIYKHSGGVQCVSIQQIIGPQQYVGVLSNINTQLIQVLLTIDKEYGNFDDLDVAITDKTPEDVKTINIQINKLIYGDNSIKIGDNNKIDKSKIGSGE